MLHIYAYCTGPTPIVKQLNHIWKALLIESQCPHQRMLRDGEGAKSASSAFSYGSPHPQKEEGGGVYSNLNKELLQPWSCCTHQVYRKKKTLTSCSPVLLNCILPDYRVSTFFPFRRSSWYWSSHASVMYYGNVFHIPELQFELLSMFNFWCWHVTLSFYFAFFRNQNSSWGQKHAICKSLANPEIAIAHILVFNAGASCDETISLSVIVTLLKLCTY